MALLIQWYNSSKHLISALWAFIAVAFVWIFSCWQSVSSFSSYWHVIILQLLIWKANDCFRKVSCLQLAVFSIESRLMLIPNLNTFIGSILIVDNQEQYRGDINFPNEHTHFVANSKYNKLMLFCYRDWQVLHLRKNYKPTHACAFIIIYTFTIHIKVLTLWIIRKIKLISTFLY